MILRLLSPHEELFPGKEEGVMCSSCAQTNVSETPNINTTPLLTAVPPIPPLFFESFLRGGGQGFLESSSVLG